MLSTNSSLIFLLFIGLLSVYALNAAESDDSPSKPMKSIKRDGVGEQKGNNNGKNVANKVAADAEPMLTTAPAGNETCNCNTTSGDHAEKGSKGYGAGSIFGMRIIWRSTLIKWKNKAIATFSFLVHIEYSCCE